MQYADKCCGESRRAANGKSASHAKRRRKPEPASSGSIPSQASDDGSQDDGNAEPDYIGAEDEEGSGKVPLEVASTVKPAQPTGKRKAAAKGKALMKDKENATPEIARRAQADRAEPKPGRCATHILAPEVLKVVHEGSQPCQTCRHSIDTG